MSLEKLRENLDHAIVEFNTNLPIMFRDFLDKNKIDKTTVYPYIPEPYFEMVPEYCQDLESFLYKCREDLFDILSVKKENIEDDFFLICIKNSLFYETEVFTEDDTFVIRYQHIMYDPSFDSIEADPHQLLSGVGCICKDTIEKVRIEYSGAKYAKKDSYSPRSCQETLFNPREKRRFGDVSPASYNETEDPALKKPHL